MEKLVVSGIGTGVGKTVVSAVFAEALAAHYWKPVQSGDLHDLDSAKVGRLAPSSHILPERCVLSIPVSPHYAAEHDGIKLSIDDFELPQSEGNLVVEGAGGLMVPLNYDGLLYIDVFKNWGLPVVLVSRHYLGSINHTLLSAEALKNQGIPLWGIVFVGDEHPPTEKVITNMVRPERTFRIPEVEVIDQVFIAEQAERLKECIHG
jgi:dethiobiotin synthetase